MTCGTATSNSPSSVGLLLHVASRRGFDHMVGLIAGLWGSWNSSGGIVLQPGIPVGPPASRFFVGFFQPTRGVTIQIIVDPVASAFAGWRVDDTGNVTACSQHKARILAHQPCREIRA